jgi:mannose-6-phosphate isomerase-like protein (cupin superfamily)
MMKRMSLAAAMLALATMPVRAQVPAEATNITAAEVQQFLAKMPRSEGGDLPIRVVDAGGYRIGVYGVFRPAAAADNASLHQTKVTEIYYILDGGGTLVTGGKLREPVARQKSAMTSSDNLRSTSGIDGGVARRVGKGDVVIIPGGVPHWWSKRDGDVTYLIIRPDPDNVLKLK